MRWHDSRTITVPRSARASARKRPPRALLARRDTPRTGSGPAKSPTAPGPPARSTGPGTTVQGRPASAQGPHQGEARIGDAGHAGVADHGHPLARAAGARRCAAPPAPCCGRGSCRSGSVQAVALPAAGGCGACPRRRRTSARGQHRQGAQADVAQVADGRGHEVAQSRRPGPPRAGSIADQWKPPAVAPAGSGPGPIGIAAPGKDRHRRRWPLEGHRRARAPPPSRPAPARSPGPRAARAQPLVHQVVQQAGRPRRR